MVVLYRTHIAEHSNWTKVENEIENINIDGIFVSFCDIFFIGLNEPIRQKWYGIIHNPIGWEAYSPWSTNKTSLFDNPTFVSSLNDCKVLFVMAKSQVEPTKLLLFSKGFTNIKVDNLYHPIDKLEYSFNYESYCLNTEKKIYNIGNWLRKQYTIFKLKCDAKFKKAIIPFTGRTVQELSFYLKLDNQYITQEEDNQVLKYNKLPDSEYHAIFQRNLVFLDVYLTTINNTFLECLISNTPMIIGRHKEYIDILGKDYPLYFDNLDEVNSLICDDNTILKAHEYLKKTDKSKFTMSHFKYQIEYVLTNIV